jgi:hypothetical protein
MHFPRKESGTIETPTKKWMSTALRLTACLACAVSFVFAASLPTTLLIRNATLVDVEKGSLVSGRTVVIVGDRINAIWASGERIRAPRGAQIIDGRGKYVIPGLIDSHVHFESQLNHCNITGDEILPLFLAGGVTTIRDAGDEIVAEKFVARYAAAHPELCPRVILCSPLIDRNPPRYRDIGWGLPQDPEKVPEFVDGMAGWGVVTLKIWVGTERLVGRRLIEEGHRHGMTVIGHLAGNYSPVDAANDGIDSLEHAGPESVFGLIAVRSGLHFTGDYADSYDGEVDLNSPTAQEVITALAKTKVMVDPTLVVFSSVSLADTAAVNQDPDNSLMPKRWQRYCLRWRRSYKPGSLERRQAQFRKYEELTGLLYRAKIPLLAGSDGPYPFCPPPGFALQKELRLLVESGLSPAGALQAATLTAARCLKQDKDIGTIEEGKIADLVILNANPLTDIRNVRDIDRVIKGGLVCDPRALLKQVPTE